MEKNIKRINKMEEILVKQEKFVKKFGKLLDEYKENFLEFEELERYYYSDEYMEDLELDEEGKLEDISRGVLSEDSVYDLISDYYNIGINMLELGTETLKR